MSHSEWYYAQEGNQHGPVAAAELKRLADAGKLRPEDLVWQDGMAKWVQARQVRGLFPAEAAGSSAPTPPPAAVPASHSGAFSSPVEDSESAFEGSAAIFARSREGSPRHVFDVLLDSARQGFPPNFVDATWRLFALCGHFVLYPAMGLTLAVCTILAVKEQKYGWLLVGMGVLFALAVLQYAARRLIVTLDRFIRVSPSQLSSSAFLDSFALVHMMLGVLVLVLLSVEAVREPNYNLVLPAVAAFILCQYGAIVALNHDTLNITISPDTIPGKEALGIFSFLVKSVTRMVPAAFGAGVIWGVVTLASACILGLAPSKETGMLEGVDAKYVPAELEALVGITRVAGAAALPVVMYLVFLFCHVVIDLLQAVLTVPDRLERLIEKND